MPHQKAASKTKKQGKPPMLRPTPPKSHYPPLFEEEYEDAPINQGLLNRKIRKSIRDDIIPSSGSSSSKQQQQQQQQQEEEWMRPYWLGSSLFLLLFAFWLLDSLKDPIFARLVDGNLDKHQPLAKLCSVATTLILVCGMEFLANLRQRREAQAEQERQPISMDDVLDPGGIWKHMPMNTKLSKEKHALDDTVSISIFAQIGIPYAIAFGIIAYFVQQFEAAEVQEEKINNDTNGLSEQQQGFDVWYVLAYLLYATIESFGSLAVATFWSFTNSTLNLDDAERYYGPIIAIAQLGAIGGSTLVASDRWKAPSLFIVVSLVIVLQCLLMKMYDRRFRPTSLLLAATTIAAAEEDGNGNDEASLLTWQDNDDTITKPFWSGVYLIFRHKYVLLILGVSCLYEVALTCLDYQMKLLGLAKFELKGVDSDNDNDNGDDANIMSFSVFMGHYGQVVNLISLFFSSMIFPWLIRRYGLRVTLRLFPTCLLFVTVIAYGALPGNLAVLFLSLSILKAMTYSIHDPSKEILYIPTSNAVKFRAKFWIDVVGERISKAIGSGFNTVAGSVDRSVQIGSLPSIVSAAGLWCVCYYAGIEFDRLLRTGKIVGLEHGADPATYKRVPKREGDEDPSEVEIAFHDDDSVSTLGTSNRPVDDPLLPLVADTPTGKILELPKFRF